MTHARTLPRHLGAAGLVAGLLVAVPSLSQATTPSMGPTTVMSVSGASGNGAQTFADLLAKTRPPSLGSNVYKRMTVPVANSTLRQGAMSALGRGVMHPGFFLALTAAQIAWNAVDGFHEEGTGTSETLSVPPSFDQYPTYSAVPQISHACQDAPSWGKRGYSGWENSTGYVGFTKIHKHPGPGTSEGVLAINNCTDLEPEGGYFPVLYFHGLITGAEYDLGTREGEFKSDPVPVSDQDLADRVDPHIPAELATQLWNGEPIPEWEHTISTVGSPSTNVQTSGDNALAPEVASAVGKWAENTEAKAAGETEPHTDAAGGGGNSADEQQLEEWSEDPPDFPAEPVPAWNVEVIDDLPDYDAGLSGGQCPAPAVIDIPLYGVVTIEWTPICDFAAMISGAVKALGMIMGLFIVLGRK